jgi:DNA-directed RNA polymerase subunit alpha
MLALCFRGGARTTVTHFRARLDRLFPLFAECLWGTNMASEVNVVSAVDEICAQPNLTPALVLKLRSVARHNLAEFKVLQTRYAALDGESLPAPEKALRQAAFAWVLNRVEQAEAALKNVSGPMAQLLKGELTLDREENAQAADLLRAAAGQFHDEPLVGVEAAAALCANGNLPEALDLLARLEQKGCQTADAAFVKGRIAEKQGLVEAACTEYEKALQLDPRHADASFRLAYHLDLRGEDERAIELYRSITKQSPAFVSAMVNLALLLEDRDRVDEAIECFKEALRVDPTNRRAQMYLRDAIESLDMYYDETERKENERLEAVLRIPISDFELSVRSRNCLAKMNVKALGDLVRRTEHELLSFKNFGETSLNEIKNLLSSKGLRLGMFREEEAKKARALRLKTGAPENSVLMRPITDLELSVRSRKCMQRLNVETVGDLTEKTEAELLAIKNFGQTSLNEVKAKLAEMGLSLKPVE